MRTMVQFEVWLSIWLGGLLVQGRDLIGQENYSRVSEPFFLLSLSLRSLYFLSTSHHFLIASHHFLRTSFSHLVIFLYILYLSPCLVTKPML
jgi:hypothetical protein